ncbi:MAG: SMC family ATPase, partial [Clostridia bacterium]|nr:SMC family ATPase [Clostridia bacterium]
VFALYGKVSRLDAKDAVIASLINYRLDKAYVNFEFEIVYGGKRRQYRVERELKRKNSQQSVRVYEREGESLLAQAEGSRDANAFLSKIIGLEQRDFEKCIALPQGEFAQFVKAARSDRLKLIARLFDLERYGEGLVKRTGAKYTAAKNEASVLEARMEPYLSVTEEAIAQAKRELKALAGQEKQAEEAQEKAREAEKKLSALYEKRKAAAEAAREMEKLEARRERMAALNAELSRLEKAATAAKAAREERDTKAKLLSAERAEKEANTTLARAEEGAKLLGEGKAEEIEARIRDLTERVKQAELAERDRKQAAELQQKITSTEREYAEEAAIYRDFDYDRECEELQKELDACGNGDFNDYAATYAKERLLRGEYAIFAEELTRLTEKYPAIAPDSKPLIEKYSGLAEGEKVDFTHVEEEFRALETRRKAAQEKRVALEQARGGYRVHLEKLQTLQTDRTRLRAEYEKLVASIPKDEGTEKLKAGLRTAEEEKKAFAERSARVARALEEARTGAALMTERANAAKERLAEVGKRLAEALLEGDFKSGAEAEELTLKYGDAESARRKVEAYREEYAAARARLRELSKEDFSEATDENVRAAREKLSEAERAVKEIARAVAVKTQEITRAEHDILVKKELAKDLAQKRKEAELYERLKKLIDGNKFMEYVAEEYLQTVAGNASGRLLSLTDGRYFLRYQDGFVVGDNFNGGETRGVYTLSGGETFLVSLALALALSGEICARSLRPIEFFFLDEGFGTLDGKLVDTVMDSLEKLKGEHFSIGIISHVEELRHRIDRKLLVTKATERHGSKITME